MIKHVELLAPAGSMASLKAAVQAGASAVYLGTDKFSARKHAANFTLDNLKTALDYAHRHGVNVYVTLNILLHDDEVPEALEVVRELEALGVDGLIVQDLGFAVKARELGTVMEIHASTQMGIDNLYGAKAVESLGFERVVLARETQLEDIRAIRDKTELDIEGFIHGALCVSMSGMCLMSSMIGGRSGNRGDCAQACRKRYKLLSGGRAFGPAYLLSPQDLASFETLDAWIDAGVSSLKIEGRMKSPHYVYQVVQTYKKQLMGTRTDKDIKNTEQIFSRGFTKGLAFHDFGSTYTASHSPKHRGRRVGTVVSVSGMKAVVDLEDSLEPGDGLYFAAHNVGKQNQCAYQPGRWTMDVPQGVVKGEAVYRTTSKALEKALDQALDEPIHPIDLAMAVVLQDGEAARLSLTAEGNRVSVMLDEPLERAKQRSLTEDQVREQLGKLGDTVYRLADLHVTLDEGLFMPLSRLNELRRRGVTALDEARLNRSRRLLSAADLSKVRVKTVSTPHVTVEVDSVTDLNKLPKDSRVLPLLKVTALNEAFSHGLKAFDHFALRMDKMATSAEVEDAVTKVTALKPTQVYLNNISGLELFRDMAIEKVADIGMNVMNSYTVSELLRRGFTKVVPSPELNRDEVLQMARDYAGVLEVQAHGLVEVMTMRHCPAAVIKGCGYKADCEACAFSRDTFLEDVRGVKFLIERRHHITELYNAYPLALFDKITPWLDAGIRGYKLHCNDDIRETVAAYLALLDGKQPASEMLKAHLSERYGDITGGHYNRGVQ
ncbi:DUF3656 domain-containing protein [Peptoniphilus equinus]|uniref:DUF3656 domain-containing protein n=1 Tax=Peptoniphilus equinus TaxID=3016343 RepID=A0ABY7QVG6_9FIRM|nr:U32 family peptidase [Peptoniphilus equinus]WBW50396.1 DUF3656 domain-containing protein [Peptoniphilus equinus]